MRSRFWMLTAALGLAACAAPATPAVVPTAEPNLPAPGVAVTEAAPQPAAPTATSAPDSVQPTATEPASPTLEPTAEPAAIAALPFVKMEEGVSGAASVDAAAGVVRFSSDFNIAPGPDLFVVLSPASNLSLDYVSFSQTVTAAGILYLGPLASTAGAQDYAIPAGTDLSQYNSVIVWCRQYSVAFAAAPLR